MFDGEMTGKSIRKAFRKFFHLRKSSSESRLTRDACHNSTINPARDVTALVGDHLIANRSNSEAIPGNTQRDDNATNEGGTMARRQTEHLQRSIQLAHQASWYWGPLEPAMAEAVLEKEKDGTFLVRDSSDRSYYFSLSCKYDGKVGHIRIENGPGYFMFRKIEHYKCENIGDFIEQAMAHSHTGSMIFMTRPRPGVAATRILLLYPLSRQRKVPSLQHLARFTILERIGRAGIAQLPVPLPLKKYLNQTQYFVEVDRQARQCD